MEFSRPAAAPAKSRRKPRRVLAATIGLLVGLGVAEVTVRCLGITREVGPSFTVWHPQDGARVKRSLQTMRIAPEFTMRFTSNADGYRGPEFPPVITRSLLCFGDSFTMGYGVNDDEVFTALLAAKVPADWTLVNAGIGGAGNGRWLHVLERERARLRPGVVLLQVCGNDFDDNLMEHLFSLDAAGQLVAHAPQPPSFVRRVQAAIDRIPLLSFSHLVGLGRQMYARVPAPPDRAPDPAVAGKGHPGRELTHALLRRIVAETRAAGAIPVAVTVEVWPAEQAALDRLFSELDVRCVRTPTKSERPEHYYEVDGHWNRAGHAAAAEQIWQELQQDRYPFAARQTK